MRVTGWRFWFSILAASLLPGLARGEIVIPRYEGADVIRRAVEKLGESVEAAPVLCEMVRDKPSRPDAVRPIFREEVRRISREAGRPLYWSRAWQTPEWKALTDPPRGRQP